MNHPENMNPPFTKDNYTSCPICDSSQKKHSFSMKENEIVINWDQCLNCGLTYQNPPLSIDVINDLYNSDHYWGHNKYGLAYQEYEKYDHIRIHQSNRRLKIIQKTTGLREGKVLDIACATGFFAYAANLMGFEAQGIEPCKHLSEYGMETYGLQITQSIFEYVDLEPNQFDLVTLWGADSHFLHPKEGFQKIKTILKPGGFLAMNYQDFSHWIRFFFPGIKKSKNVIFNLSKQSLDTLFDQLRLEILYHAMEWQTSTFNHISRILRVRFPESLSNTKILVPAISFPMVIAKKSSE